MAGRLPLTFESQSTKAPLAKWGCQPRARHSDIFNKRRYIQAAHGGSYPATDRIYM